MQHRYDLELRTYFYDRKKEVKEQFVDYTKKHAEIRQILNDYTSELLFQKPDNVYKFTQEYFAFYNVKAGDPYRYPLVLAGPKRAGRRTMALELCKKHPEKFALAISHTTRPAREHEVEGKNYHFVTKDQFMDLIAKNVFYEWFEQDGIYYGMHMDNLKKIMGEMKIPIIIMGTQGLQELKKLTLECCPVVVIPASIDTYKNKMTHYLNQELQSKNFSFNTRVLGGLKKDIELYAGMKEEYPLIMSDQKGKGLSELLELIQAKYTDLL